MSQGPQTNWLEGLSNWRQFVMQMGALGVSWLVFAAFLWAGWTLLNSEINYLHQQLEEARQERSTDHQKIMKELKDLNQ